MSGLIDTKSRVMDVVLTDEGRRQLSEGGLKIDSYSFTDVGTFYQADVVSGSADASLRLSFEASCLPQDNIMFTAKEGGRLSSADGRSGLIANGQLLEFGTTARTVSTLTGSALSNRVDSMMQLPVENFRKLRLLSTSDSLFEDEGFSIGPSSVSYTVTNERPISDRAMWSIDINALDGIMQDPKLSKLRNFKYLPPINKNSKDRQSDKRSLGPYAPWDGAQGQKYTEVQLEEELQNLRALGQVKDFSFDPTTSNNRIIGQFIELGSTSVSALDLIDYGTYVFNGKKKHAFFAGKRLIDDNGNETFVHVFTLVFG